MGPLLRGPWSPAPGAKQNENVEVHTHKRIITNFSAFGSNITMRLLLILHQIHKVNAYYTAACLAKVYWSVVELLILIGSKELL